MEWEFQTGIDFWSYGHANEVFRIMVSPEIELNFLNFLNKNEVDYKIGIENVETSLKSDKITKRSLRLANALPNFNYYWSYPEMEEIFNRLATNYPNLVKLETEDTCDKKCIKVYMNILSGNPHTTSFVNID